MKFTRYQLFEKWHFPIYETLGVPRDQHKPDCLCKTADTGESRPIHTLIEPSPCYVG
jgi:hypothetical protein